MTLKESVYECDNCGAEFSCSHSYTQSDHSHMVMNLPPMIMGYQIDNIELTELAPHHKTSVHLCNECQALFVKMWYKNERRKNKKDE